MKKIKWSKDFPGKKFSKKMGVKVRDSSFTRIFFHFGVFDNALLFLFMASFRYYMNLHMSVPTNTRYQPFFLDFLSSFNYASLGCFKDKRGGAIPSMERTDALLKDNYSQRKHAIQKCAVAALTRGYRVFAIQDGGMCVSSPNAHKVYGKYGKSQDCKNDGKGGAGANQVYNLTGTMEGTDGLILRYLSYLFSYNFL